jgi:hypothetical protein
VIASRLLRVSLVDLLLFVSLAVTPVRATDISQKLTMEMARRLAAEGFPYIKDLSHFDYDKQDKSFFVFAPLGGEYGTAPVGWLGVNPWTGDVWNVWRCTRLSTPLLRKSQAVIRRGFRPDELRQYARLRALRPVCYGP